MFIDKKFSLTPFFAAFEIVSAELAKVRGELAVKVETVASLEAKVCLTIFFVWMEIGIVDVI